MKQLLPTLCLLVFPITFLLQAQTFDADQSTSFVVWDVKGKVKVEASGSSNKIPVVPGMTIEDDATVNVPKRASVQMVREKDIVSISKKGKYQMNGNFGGLEKKQSEATAYFFEKLIASKKYHDQKNKLVEKGGGYGTEDAKRAKDDKGGGYGTEDAKRAKDDKGGGYGTEDAKKAKDDKGGGYGTEDAKKAKDDKGGGYGTEDAKKAKDDKGGGYGTEDAKRAKDDKGGGYGTEDAKRAKDDKGGGYGTEDAKRAKDDKGGGYGTEDEIAILSPKVGISLSGKSVLSWTSLDEGEIYGLTVTNEDGDLILYAQTNKNHFTFYADEIATEEKEQYFLQVETLGRKGGTSGKKAITFLSLEEKEKILAPLMADPFYQRGNRVQQLLMKATTMEKAGLFSEAAAYYKTALSIAADNPIANQMYKAFLDRDE